MINFEIHVQGTISKLFIKKGIYNFHEAKNYVRLLPYGRNANKDDLTTIFADNCGTCSTKHALLKQLAIENNISEVQLVIGLFKMNSTNTPEVKHTLEKHELVFIPEAHCYLKVNDQIIDVTKANSKPEDFIKDLIEEREILPYQITFFKENYHKESLQKWLKENSEIKFTSSQLWAIREKCIMDLQTN